VARVAGPLRGSDKSDRKKDNNLPADVATAK
jgi:hypothetical protein